MIDREETAHAFIISSAAEIVAIALFCAMIFVWFGVILPGSVR